MAANALLECGKRRLAFLNSQNSTYSGRARGDAFVTAIAPALARGEVTFRPVFCNTSDYDGGYRAAFDILKGPDAPDAIFCSKDHIALGLLDAARFDLGLRVPEDLAVIGFDDIEAAGQRAYRLTTIRQSAAELAKLSIERLQSRIDNPDEPDCRVSLPVELVRRDTV